MSRIATKISVIDDKHYELLEDTTYYSERYNKYVTVRAGIYDGATGATDIMSASWLVHDQLCKTALWDDGTSVTNWQASQVLQDILRSEGRWLRSKYWFWFTYLFGGKKLK